MLEIKDKIAKRMKGRGRKDGNSYTDFDSGCCKATYFLGRQSSCLKCPFESCVLRNYHKEEKATC